MHQEQINVSKTPSLILLLGHGERVLAAVVVVPQLGSDEDFLAGDEAIGNGAADSLASLLFVLVIVGSIEQPVSGFDGLLGIRKFFVMISFKLE